MKNLEDRDGTGAQIISHALYYVQNKHLFCGNGVMWWRHGGAGYTDNLLEAGIYRGDELPGSVDHGEVYWPVDLVRYCTIVQVDTQRLNRVAQGARDDQKRKREGADPT